MRCRDIRDRLLEADPAELRGEVEGDLATHLAACLTCRRAADQILAAEDALRAHLQRAAPARTAAEALPLARARARHARRRRRLVAAIPVLAAAGIVLALLLGRRNQGPAPTVATVPTVPTVPIVDATPGQQVAVFETSNPNIVIVWTF